MINNVISKVKTNIVGSSQFVVVKMFGAIGLCVGFLIFTICFLPDKNPEPIFGIYPRINGVYWIKVLFMYILLSLKKIRQRLFPHSQEYYNKLDNVQKLASTPKAVDAVFFNAANKHGDHLNVGTARRVNRLVDGFLYLKINSSKYSVLESPKLPDTSLFNSGEEHSYEAEGIKITPIEPMKEWKLVFDGQLKEANNEPQLHHVSIQARFTSGEPWFSYDAGMDAWSMAKILAYEKWSRTYFQNLKGTHQMHYEQFGTLKAQIKVDDEEYDVEFDALRDHTVGDHRDWAKFRRYVIHWVTTENGDRFSVGSVCHPLTFSRMQIGYMYNAQDRKMYPITDSDLHLYQYGELGNPPMDYAFTFRAGKTDYAMRVNISDAPYFYISKQWEAKVYECLCTVEINGVKGHGGVEWEYRNVEGRNVKDEK